MVWRERADEGVEGIIPLAEPLLGTPRQKHCQQPCSEVISEVGYGVFGFEESSVTALLATRLYCRVYMLYSVPFLSCQERYVARTIRSCAI